MSRHEKIGERGYFKVEIRKPERIPSREEILSLIRGRAEHTTILDERRDGVAIYYFEAKTPETTPGNYTVYTYQRKGTFPEQAAAAVTCLEAVYFSGGEPCGGDILAELDPETNEWVDKS